MARARAVASRAAMAAAMAAGLSGSAGAMAAGQQGPTLMDQVCSGIDQKPTAGGGRDSWTAVIEVSGPVVGKAAKRIQMDVSESDQKGSWYWEGDSHPYVKRQATVLVGGQPVVKNEKGAVCDGLAARLAPVGLAGGGTAFRYRIEFQTLAGMENVEGIDIPSVKTQNVSGILPADGPYAVRVQAGEGLTATIRLAPAAR